MESRRLLVDGWWGCHVPERFVNNYDTKKWHCKELAKELKKSLKKTEKEDDADEYEIQSWLWDDILNKAWWKDEDGTRWHLEQDDDLFAVKDASDDD